MGCSGTTGAAIEPKDEDKLENEQVNEVELTDPLGRNTSKTEQTNSSPGNSTCHIKQYVSRHKEI